MSILSIIALLFCWVFFAAAFVLYNRNKRLREHIRILRSEKQSYTRDYETTKELYNSLWHDSQKAEEEAKAANRMLELLLSHLTPGHLTDINKTIIQRVFSTNQEEPNVHQDRPAQELQGTAS